MRNKSKSTLGRPPVIVIDLVSDTKDDDPSTSTELISPVDTPSFSEGVPIMPSLTVTSMSNDTFCDTLHSERVELETFLQQPPIAMKELVLHPKLKVLPFGLELLQFRTLRSPSSTLFQDFSHFFKKLKQVDISRWRYHTFERNKIPDSEKRPPFVEEWINVYVRDNGNLPASNCFESCMVEDIDYFVGESRLLQYRALRCLRLGDIALCKAIAKVRKDMFYPDYASSIDWDRRRSTLSSALSMPSRSSSSAAASCPPLSTTGESTTAPKTRRREEETLANKEAISDDDNNAIVTQHPAPHTHLHEQRVTGDSKPVPTRHRVTSSKLSDNRDLPFYNLKKG